MIDIELYRLRIGNFHSVTSRIQKLVYSILRTWKTTFGSLLTDCFCTSFMVMVFIGTLTYNCNFVHDDFKKNLCQQLCEDIHCFPHPWIMYTNILITALLFTYMILRWHHKCSLSVHQSMGQNKNKQFRHISKKMKSNYQAKYIHGNIERGIKNVHINIRSLGNKVNELKHL